MKIEFIDNFIEDLGKCTEPKDFIKRKNKIVKSVETDAKIRKKVRGLKNSDNITERAFSRAILYEAGKIKKEEAFPYSINMKKGSLDK